MSSTNRGNRISTPDYYVTQPEVIEHFLGAWKKVSTEEYPFPTDPVLDPCAGGDERHQMSYPFVLKQFGFKDVTTVDMREDSRAAIKADYLQWTAPQKYNLIITNPPFHLALPIISKALNDVADGGYIAMLARLNFFGSKARYDWFQDFMPLYAFVHSRRVKFMNYKENDNLSTDSIEYMHAVWKKGFNPKFTQLKII